MAETKLPAAEAAEAAQDELQAYELAFHVLPTVAEGEVSGAFEKIKAHISSLEGVLFDEESPERVDLAYDIVENFEGKNRKYHSAYFGWIRFRTVASNIADLQEALEADTNILRHLLLKLTKVEEANPFRYHEALKEQKVVTIEETEAPVEVKTEVEESAEVQDEELDESLEKITEDADVTEGEDGAEEETKA